MAPIFWPSRSLKIAIDFLALVTTGCWPVMARSSSTAVSMIFGFVDGLAEAHVDGDLREARHLHRVLASLNSCDQLRANLGVVELAQARRRRALDPLGGDLRRGRSAALPLPPSRLGAAALPLASPRRLLGGRLGLLLGLARASRPCRLRLSFSSSHRLSPLPLGSLGGLERRAALDADAALRLTLVVLVRPAARLATHLVAPEHHVRRVDRALLLEDAALRVALASAWCGA